jgi:hypothetical protein
MKAKTYTGKVIFAIAMLYVIVHFVAPAVQTAATKAENQYMSNVYNQVSQTFNSYK